MDGKTKLDSCINHFETRWEFSEKFQQFVVRVDSYGLNELLDAINQLAKVRNCPPHISTYVSNISTYLLSGRSLMNEIQEEYSKNSITLTALSYPHIMHDKQSYHRSTSFDLKTTINLQNKIREYQLILTRHEENSVSGSSQLFLQNSILPEIFIMICELKKRFITECFCQVLSSQCVTGHVGNMNFSVSEIEYSNKLFLATESEYKLFHEFVRTKLLTYKSIIPSQYHDSFFSSYFKLIDEFYELSKYVVNIRLSLLAVDWKAVEITFTESKTHLHKYISIYEELQLVESEVDHRNLIQEMISSIEDLEITLIPNTNNLNPSIITFHRLESVIEWATRRGCHSQFSMELNNLCATVLRILKLIQSNEAHQISLAAMLEVQQKVNVMGISSNRLTIVLTYVRCHQIIHTIYVAVTNTKDSKSVYVVLSNAEKACGGIFEISLQPWIDVANDLRYLRTLFFNQDWLSILHHSQEMEKSLNCLQCYSEEQSNLFEVLNTERIECHRRALEEHTRVQVAVMSSVGGIGARGTSSYYAPEMGISVLKGVISTINRLSGDTKVLSPDIIANKNRLSALLTLRESVYDEVHIGGIPNRISSRKIDRCEDNLENIPVLESTSASRILAARKRTMKTLEDTELIMKTSTQIQKEYQFTASMSKLANLVENLEETALLPIVGWKTSTNQVQFFPENSVKQQGVLQQLADAFPDKVSDISLVSVVTDLNTLLAIAQTNDDYSILDNMLNSFSLKIQVADISPRVLFSLKEQVSVFQKGHLLDQLTSLAEEGCHLLEILCFKREVLDEYLTKFTYLANSAGEQSVPQETMSCIRCIKSCRDLCWASELQMGIEFQRFKKQLDREAEDVPSWFHEKLTRWTKNLPPPLYMPTTRGSISQVGKRSMLRPQTQAPLRKPPRLSDVSDVQDIRFSLKNLSHCLSLMVTKKHTPEFPLYQKPFYDWSNRVLLLNTLWRGIFCLTEDWVTPFLKRSSPNLPEVQSSVAFSLRPSVSTMFHTDIHALSILCSILNEALSKENNQHLQLIVKNIAKSFNDVLMTLQPYAYNNFQIPKSPKQGDIIFRRLVEFSHQINSNSESQRMIHHVETISDCFHFARKCIDVLQSIGREIKIFYLSTVHFRTAYKFKYLNSISYCYLSSTVKSKNKFRFSVHDPENGWSAILSGSVRILKRICCKWDDTKRNGLFEIIHALQQSTNSSARFIYRYQSTDGENSLYCLNVRSIQNRTIMTIFDPHLNECISVESTPEFHYLLRSNTRAVKMICAGADVLEQYWSAYLDPSLVSSVQDILGPANTGNANADLSTVLKSAIDNIKNSIRVLEQKCSFLLLTQVGFCLTNYSPWRLDWIDGLTVEDAIKVIYPDYLH